MLALRKGHPLEDPAGYGRRSWPSLSDQQSPKCHRCPGARHETHARALALEEFPDLRSCHRLWTPRAKQNPTSDSPVPRGSPWQSVSPRGKAHCVGLQMAAEPKLLGPPARPEGFGDV